MSKTDYYILLGISKSATQDEIKKAYRDLAMKHHPDKNPDKKDAEAKFKEINEAYEVLKDEQKRAAYDRYGHNASQAGGGGFSGGAGFHPDVNDIFGEFFSDFMGGAKRKKTSTQTRGSDLKYNISINLEEAFSGADKNVNFSTEVRCHNCQGKGSEDASVTSCDSCKGHGTIRMQQGFFTLEQTCSKCQGLGQFIKNPCKKCNGYGRYNGQKNLLVNIPAGVENGTRIRLVGEGEAGVRGGTAGDLYVFVNINQHNIYKVEGSDLHCVLPINFVKATLGGEAEVPTIEGGKVSITIPPASQNGNILRIKSKGMSKVRNPNRGDMFVHINIEIPKNLNKKQRELLEALEKEFISEDNSGFLNKVKNLWS